MGDPMEGTCNHGRTRDQGCDDCEDGRSYDEPPARIDLPIRLEDYGITSADLEVRSERQSSISMSRSTLPTHASTARSRCCVRPGSRSRVRYRQELRDWLVQLDQRLQELEFGDE